MRLWSVPVGKNPDTESGAYNEDGKTKQECKYRGSGMPGIEVIKRLQIYIHHHCANLVTLQIYKIKMKPWQKRSVF